MEAINSGPHRHSFGIDTSVGSDGENQFCALKKGVRGALRASVIEDSDGYFGARLKLGTCPVISPLTEKIDPDPPLSAMLG